MRILHLASFNGNIGDMANHNGIYKLFKKYVSNDVEFIPLEIREFYKSWNIRKYDDELIDYINTYDAFVIGGGNFWDIKWDYSQTGTTIDFSIERFEKIKCPVIFNGLGVDLSYEANYLENTKKFKKFFEYIVKKNNTVVSVRNDDSVNFLRDIISKEALDETYIIPDGGFFTEASQYYHPEIPKDKKIIALNTAKDRFEERWDKKIFSYEEYCMEMGEVIDEIVGEDESIHLVIVPHIPSDMEACYDILRNVNDKIVRNNITVAPCLNGENTPGDYIVDLYRRSDLVLGARYHANICAIAMERPSIAIISLQEIMELHKNIGLENRVVYVNKGSFKKDLLEKIREMLVNSDIYEQEAMHLQTKFEEDIIPYFQSIKTLLKQTDDR